MPSRTRRTLQYAPAIYPERVRAAAAGGADAVIVDLESTVPDDRKAEARENLPALFERNDFGGKETVVRINDLRSTEWLADVEAAIDVGVDTLRLPKVEEPWQVRTAVETARQLADPVPEFLLQLETPRGVANGMEIATTCRELPMVTGIGIGMGDYTNALGLSDHTPELRAYLLNRTAMYAQVGEMDALGFVHKELDTLRPIAEQARSLGHVGQPISYKVDAEPFVEILTDVYTD